MLQLCYLHVYENQAIAMNLPTLLRSFGLIYIALLVGLMGCAKKGNSPQIPTSDPFFVKGADISWLTQMETSGKLFYDTNGTTSDLLPLLKGYGINTIRLRVWVNPSGGWNGQQDVIAKAQRAKAAGMRLLINFHYSDSWADPGQQTKPANWQNAPFNSLKDSLAAHTTQVLTALKTAGVSPHWVQIGNETNNGMLWPEGRASTQMANFAALINAGYQASKAVFPSAQVMVHLSNGYDSSLYRWMLDGLVANNAQFDLVGMSLYPSINDWSVKAEQCRSNMQMVVNRYNKPVMLVEIGMPWDAPEQSRLFIADLIAKTKSLPANQGLGVMYWEPQAYNWQGYTLGCFDLSGKPTRAMLGFGDGNR